MVGLGGLEPPTSRLSSARSNQLSYKPGHPDLRHRPTAVREARLVVREERETKAARPRLVRRPDDFSGHCPKRTEWERPTSGIPKGFFLRKEVIQPQVPLRLPCYDFTPVADPTVAGCFLAVSAPSSGKANSHGVTGGVYKARERIHRGMLIRDY